MPAKSIIETRIREKLEVARGNEREASVWVENSTADLEAARRRLSRVRSDIATLEDLLAPESGEEGSTFQPPYVPGEDASDE